jgi:electron transfer flavoprotein beta subunit
MINIIVCMKQVLDPEAPVSAFKIDPEAKRAIPPKGTPPVLNPNDENALEAALKIKDAQPAQITVISMGRQLARPVVKKSLAVGANDLILLEDDTFEDLDSYSSAFILAAAIKKIGKYDLILCGRQAADTDAGQVGSGIAEILGIPGITITRRVQVNDGKLRIERVVSDGYEVVEVSMPALVTTSNEVGDLRSPNMKAVMEAQKKQFTVWHAADLGIKPAEVKRANMLKLFVPVHEVNVEVVGGETPEEAAVNLALKMRANKLV